MERFVLAVCAVIILSIMYQEVASAPQTKQQLWINSNLQRKKRNLDYFKPSSDQLETLIDTIEGSPWAIVTLNEAKRHSSSYTPRLGRDLDDGWLTEGEVGEMMVQRSPPFAPRLGRGLSSYSTQMGRSEKQH